MWTSRQTNPTTLAVFVLLPSLALAQTARRTDAAAESLITQADTARFTGDADGARDLYEKAAQAAKTASAADSEHAALTKLAQLHRASGQHQDAVAASFRALGAARATGKQRTIGTAQVALAEHHAAGGDLESALPNLEAAAALFESTGDAQGAGDALARAGELVLRKADFTAAGTFLERAAAAHRKGSNAPLEADALARAAVTWDLAGDPARAGPARLNARQLVPAAERDVVLGAYDQVGALLLEAGRSEALTAWRKGREFASAGGNAADEVHFMLRVAQALYAGGDRSGAHSLVDDARAKAMGAGLNEVAGLADAVRGQLHLASKSYSDAVRVLESAALALKTLPVLESGTQESLALGYAGLGQWRRAADALEAAARLYDAQQDHAGSARVLTELASAKKVLGDEAGAREAATRAAKASELAGDAPRTEQMTAFLELVRAALPQPAPPAQPLPLPTPKPLPTPAAPEPTISRPSISLRPSLDVWIGHSTYARPVSELTAIGAGLTLGISRLQLRARVDTIDEALLYDSDATLGTSFHLGGPLGLRLSAGVGVSGATEGDGSAWAVPFAVGIPASVALRLRLMSRSSLTAGVWGRWNLGDARGQTSTDFAFLDVAGLDDGSLFIEASYYFGPFDVAAGYARGGLNGTPVSTLYAAIGF